MREIIRILINARENLFPNFRSILAFDYLLISWVTYYAHKRGFLTEISFFLSRDKEDNSL